MAYTYKSIGNTAAAVVSLLAIGTVCWWQRTPGPINAPRPQDEAEIMTAILERHYAMGQMNVLYGTSKDAYISTVADSNAPGGVRYVTNSEAYTLTNTIGFFPNAPFRFASGVRAAFLGRDTRASFYGWGYGYSGDINLQHWYVPGVGGLVYCPPQDRIDYYARIFDTTINVGWIIPDDVYMLTGDTSWFGATIHSNVFSGPLNYWDRWDSDEDWYYGASWGEFADRWFSRSQFVWTNFVSKCGSTWRTTTNYATSYVTNRIIGGVTNTITNTTFSTTNYVATGSVNTYVSEVGNVYGECAAMMFPFERDTPGITRVDANGDIGFDGEPAGKYHPAFWSTNVYRDMGRALSLLQWVRDYAQPRTNVYWYYMYTNNVLASYNSTTQFSVANPYINKVWFQFKDGRTRAQVSGITVLYDFVNNTPFPVDTVLFQPLSSVSDGTSYDSLTSPTTIDGPIASGTTGTTGWFPDEPASFSGEIQSIAAAMDGGHYEWTTIWTRYIPYDCYHVQFTALTNYLDHAPAR